MCVSVCLIVTFWPWLFFFPHRRPHAQKEARTWHLRLGESLCGTFLHCNTPVPNIHPSIMNHRLSCAQDGGGVAAYRSCWGGGVTLEQSYQQALTYFKRIKTCNLKTRLQLNVNVFDWKGSDACFVVCWNWWVVDSASFNFNICTPCFSPVPHSQNSVRQQVFYQIYFCSHIWIQRLRKILPSILNWKP